MTSNVPRPRDSGCAHRVGAFVDRIPLRVRLVVAVLALVAVAQVATGAAAIAALDEYLTTRLDGQLVASAASTAQHVGRRGRLDSAAIDSSDLNNSALATIDLARLDLPGTVYARVDSPLGAGDARLTHGGQHAPVIPPATPFNTPTTVSGTGGDGPWRAIVEPVPGTGATLTMAVSLDEQAAIVTNLVVIDAVVSTVVLLVLGGVGYLLVRASLRPLRQVDTVAAAIADGQFGQRVPERDPRTEVGRLGRSLNLMLAHIERAIGDRERSEAQARASEERMRRFIADAGHELRTPLTSIRGFAELYRQGAATNEVDVSRFMRRIEAESYRMGLLIEDLLLLARLDQPRRLRRRPVDLAVLAANAVHDARAIAPDRRITLRTNGSCVITGDGPRLRQVLGNLVGNALTHTPAGTPVTVAVTRDGASGVLLEVIDRGPGMTPEHAARAFERFYRADASRARNTGGSGLGLAIVAAVVAAHEGTVSVETAPGSGATFRVRLRVSTHAIPKARRGAVDGSALRGRRGPPAQHDSPTQHDSPAQHCAAGASESVAGNRTQ